MRSARHTLTTRLLFTVLPSERYAPKGRSLQTLLTTLVDDLNRAAEEGIEAHLVDFLLLMMRPVTLLKKSIQFTLVPWEVVHGGQRHRFYAQCIGTKGDWPWQRSAWKLYAGFTSKQLCHLCAAHDPQTALHHMFSLWVSCLGQ